MRFRVKDEETAAEIFWRELIDEIAHGELGILDLDIEEVHDDA